MMGYFKDDKGNDSIMRLLAFMGFWLGGGIAVAGLVGLFLQIPNMVTPIVTGTALASGGEVLKAIQKKFEQVAK
jgi:hypothetical protein